MKKESDQLDNLKKAVAIALDHGYQLDREAFEFLSGKAGSEDVLEIVRRAIENAKEQTEDRMFISSQLLENAFQQLKKGEETDQRAETITTPKETFTPYAKEIEAEIKILQDPTAEISSTGSMEDFLKYFHDRFQRIKRILLERLDTRDAVPILTALETKPRDKVKVIGMITEKMERSRRVFLRIEDPDAAATFMVPANAPPQLMEKAHNLLLDGVACVKATHVRDDLFMVNDFIMPDLPERKTTGAPTPAFVALTSDLHVGSQQLARKCLENFIAWLNGKTGNSTQRDVAGRVKYIMIAGDIVDGIGVYPNQESELEIQDLYQQYHEASKLLKEIPEYIQIVIIPGNHDATRQALPQPAISPKYAGEIYELKNVMMLGNPAKISISGVSFLLYHGRSLEDVIGSAPNLRYQNPEKAMELLLKTRHLAPVYGKKTPIAPEGRDMLVIDKPPEVFHSGHIHINGYEHYKGTLVVNSGAWQMQTSYQKLMGLNPTYGRVPLLDLQFMNMHEINFKAPEAQ